MVFVDGAFVGEQWDGEHSAGDVSVSVSVSASLGAGAHSLSVVSSSLGISNGIANGQPASAQDMKGIVGAHSVWVGGADVTQGGWAHWVGRTGEALAVAGGGMHSVAWTAPADASQPMTWFRTAFATPSEAHEADGQGVILIDIGASGGGMRRGHWWLNGRDMGHYNEVALGGLMVQRYYFVPNDYLAADAPNTLLFAEEREGAKVDGVSVVYSTFVVP